MTAAAERIRALREHHPALADYLMRAERSAAPAHAASVNAILAEFIEGLPAPLPELPERLLQDSYLLMASYTKPHEAEREMMTVRARWLPLWERAEDAVTERKLPSWVGLLIRKRMLGVVRAHRLASRIAMGKVPGARPGIANSDAAPGTNLALVTSS